ncbi:hypothetical protein F7725_010070, partial [Dissostichus mawsoni]
MKSHLSYQLATAVHAQVEIGFFAPDSHLATKGISLHYELGFADSTSQHLDVFAAGAAVELVDPVVSRLMVSRTCVWFSTCTLKLTPST